MKTDRSPAPIVLLGPQRYEPTLADAVRSLGITGELATVTSGWQEREGEDAELRDHLAARGLNLMLHRRGEEVFAEDRELAAAHHLRQERLRQLQWLYRMRLGHAKEAAREMMRAEADPGLLSTELADALGALQALDAHHEARVRAILDVFDEQWDPLRRRSVARHRDEIASLLERCTALAIAGGHVAVLLNRLRLFGVAALAAGKPIIAWSAGAMAVTDRVVLFHDSPPQGAGVAEVLAPGLGLFPDVVALPHAAARLSLGDPKRVALFARRFEPAACVVLDKSARLEWDGKAVRAASGTRSLAPDGAVREMVAA